MTSGHSGNGYLHHDGAAARYGAGESRRARRDRPRRSGAMDFPLVGGLDEHDLQGEIEHVNHTTSRASVRTHSVLVDRGVAKGGLDLGPAGGEYLLVSLGGRFTSHLVAAIRAREAAVSNVRVTVTGTMAGIPERCTALAMDVSAECQDSALVCKLITIAARSVRSPIRSAGGAHRRRLRGLAR